MNETVVLTDTREQALFTGWLRAYDLQVIAKRVGTPVFIYSETQLSRNVQRITDAAMAAGIGHRVELYVPFFPNSNPHVFHPFQRLGVGLLVQLPSEYEILRRFGFRKFIVSTGHVSDADISFWAETECSMFLSSLDEITYLMRRHPGAPINVRFDSLNCGKPGIKYGELQTLAQLLSAAERRLDCFELYCGSGHTMEEMISVVEQIFMIFTTYFPKAQAINFAGGYGFDYCETDTAKKHFDWQTYLTALHDTAERYRIPAHVKFLFEPARDLLGDIAALLLSVERRVIRHPGANRLLTNGSRVLMPSAQYKERRHNVVFLDSTMTERTSRKIPAALRGRGILRHDYILPGDYLVPEDIEVGDHLLVLDVGAYCATQHMEFLNIPPAAEVLVDGAGSSYLITAPGDRLDKWRYLLPDKRELAVL